jgi:hypothetical protein
VEVVLLLLLLGLTKQAQEVQVDLLQELSEMVVVLVELEV